MPWMRKQPNRYCQDDEEISQHNVDLATKLHSPFRGGKRQLFACHSACEAIISLRSGHSRDSSAALRTRDDNRASGLLLTVTHPHENDFQVIVEENVCAERRAAARLSGDLKGNVVEAQVSKPYVVSLLWGGQVLVFDERKARPIQIDAT